MERSEKLIQTIKEQHIQPVPRWKFTLQNTLIWLSFAVAVLMGALAFSVVLFAIQQTDFNVLSHLSHSRLEMFLGLLPFLWILFLVVFLIIAIYSIQYSKKGYKLTMAKMAGYSAALSILLGTLFFIGGGGHQLEHAFATQVSLYESVQEKKLKLWSMPEDGYLSGEIEKVNPEDFQMKDFSGKTWTIRYEGAFIPPSVLLERGEKVKIVGKMQSDKEFKADEVRPWGGGPGNRRRNKGMNNDE